MEDDEKSKKKDFGKKKDGKKDKKDKAYQKFEEDDSAEEVLVGQDEKDGRSRIYIYIKLAISSTLFF